MQKKKTNTIFIEGLENHLNESYTQKPNLVFETIEAFAKETKFPILATNSGAILLFLTKTLKPKSILELGTGLGYSTLWFLASHLPKLEITTVDRESKNQDYAKKQIESSYPNSKISFVESDCVEFLQNTNQNFDLIFVDCDKVSYPNCWDLILKKSSAKYVIFDNMLWGGRVLNKSENLSDLSISQTWLEIKNSNKSYTLFPSGDGLLLVELNKECPK